MQRSHRYKAEAEVLEEVAILDESRILSLVEKLEKGKIRHVFQLAISRLSSSNCNEDILKEPDFARWIKTCPFTTTSLGFHGTPQLITLVKWSSQARWVYPKHLQVLLASVSTPTPPWMETLYKLARYWGAIKSMVKLAVKQPELFASICIQDVEGPCTAALLAFSRENTSPDSSSRDWSSKIARLSWISWPNAGRQMT